jgi:hypothetical protein
MQLNFIGLTAAASAFLGIWLGHVLVRKIEARTLKLWVPIMTALVIGLGLVYRSLTTHHLYLSAVTGILGITALWDALEFVRQEKRVKKGHAPANPDNPRHAHILEEHPSATTLDLLDREPVGHPVTLEEAARLIIHHR